MSDDELIASQTRHIAKLEAKNAELMVAVDAVRLQIICIGGPLNDNKLKYSNAQLVTFQKIMDLTDGFHR